MSVEQQVATGRGTAGVDRASHAHAVALVDGDGVQSQRFTVAHTATELQQMVQRLRCLSSTGIENVLLCR